MMHIRAAGLALAVVTAWYLGATDLGQAAEASAPLAPRLQAAGSPPSPSPAAAPVGVTEPGHLLDWLQIDPTAVPTWQLSPGATAQSAEFRHRDDASPDAKKVLVLYSSASSAYDTALTEILRQFETHRLHAKVTVTTINGDAKAALAIADAAQTNGYDLIFAIGSQVTDALHKTYRGGPLPVVSVCAKDPVLLGQASNYHSGSGTNFVYTSLNVPIAVQYTYLRLLRPHLRNIAILYSEDNVSTIKTQLRPLASHARSAGLQVIEVGVHDATAASQLTEAVPQAVQRMRATDPHLRDSIFWVTGSTSVFSQIAVINQGAGMVPVISAVPDIVRSGDDSAVVSIGVGFDTNARVAAHYAIAILEGRARPGDLAVGLVSPPDIAINFRRARAIGLQVPFSFFESASTIYDPSGALVRVDNTE